MLLQEHQRAAGDPGGRASGLLCLGLPSPSLPPATGRSPAPAAASATSIRRAPGALPPARQPASTPRSDMTGPVTSLERNERASHVVAPVVGAVTTATKRASGADGTDGTSPGPARASQAAATPRAPHRARAGKRATDAGPARTARRAVRRAVRPAVRRAVRPAVRPTVRRRGRSSGRSADPLALTCAPVRNPISCLHGHRWPPMAVTGGSRPCNGPQTAPASRLPLLHSGPAAAVVRRGGAWSPIRPNGEATR